MRLAWIYIRRFGLETATELLCKQIKSYLAALGAEEKFNTTVTVAATKAVHHFMLRPDTTTFKDFILESPRLKTTFKDLMAAHYGFDIFKNPVAKKTYLEPDLIPFSA